ncbi:hypothetical protein BDW59DRAFT_104490 [Aspergillus cavernicola]|uniref:Uncharacterized protein n=1 Tax=Aspergillus cavernicola TaxID=176166 RepID=A0ABR4IYL3_9EURO
MSLSKSETDIILNKANIALARSQRLVASWLPVQTQADQSNAKPDEELQREEDEIFTAVPETLGLGAPLPTKAANGSWNRTEIDSNDALRKQLLGRNYKKVMAEKARQRAVDLGSISSMNGSTYLKGNNDGNNAVDDDDDDDEGRTASIGRKTTSKKRKTDDSAESMQTGSLDEPKNEDSRDDGGEKAATSRQGQGPKGRKKATSFLDEILAERSKKRKKR